MACFRGDLGVYEPRRAAQYRSEEHTSELQSRSDLVCRLLLEKKKKHNRNNLAIERIHAPIYLAAISIAHLNRALHGITSVEVHVRIARSNLVNLRCVSLLRKS